MKLPRNESRSAKSAKTPLQLCEIRVDFLRRLYQSAESSLTIGSSMIVARPEDYMELAWGKKYLMCAPEHFGVIYEINPWMNAKIPVDRERAHEQWAQLLAAIRLAGGEVELLEPQDGIPDLVFTANAGVVNDDRFVAARFMFPVRQGETPVDEAWFAANGFRVQELPSGMHQEGGGDVLPWLDGYICGYGFRSDPESVCALSTLLGVSTHGVRLVDPRMYHLDIAFCPLDDRHALIAPDAFDAMSVECLMDLVPEPLMLTLEESLSFCGNSIVIGKHVIMPTTAPRVVEQLEAWDFTVEQLDVTEFLKAGGAVRCLTLALDVSIPPSAQQERLAG